MAPAIEVRGVSKKFRVYQEKYNSLKERVIHFGQQPHREFHALRDVDLVVQQGETLGLLGHNGSGKSTLLKCLAGILQPDTGSIVTTGRIAALLELGAGFHPDLTGRENVYMNASILGMRREEVDRKFDDIVAFAELEEFIDNQVKHYSSGMYVRLGFAIAINVDPDLLLVDEVLAVGDEAFQQKCINQVRHFQREGRTIVFVTHAADLVRQLCTRAAALDHGEVFVDAEPGEAIRAFRERLMGGITSYAESPAVETEFSPLWHHVRITGSAAGPAGDPAGLVHTGGTAEVSISYECERPVDDVVFALTLYSDSGVNLLSTNTRIAGADLGTLAGAGRLVFRLDPLPLLPGTYSASLGIHTVDGVVYDRQERACSFEVVHEGPERRGVVDIPVAVRLERREAGVSLPPPRSAG